jgi:hypothetical protein
MMNGSSDQIKNYPHVTNHREFAMQVLKLLGEIPGSFQLPDDPFAPGSTQYMKPGEREAARRARAAAKTAKVDIRSKAASDRRIRGEIRQRAEKLVDVLYPDASNQELVFTIRQEDDEGTLVDSLFGFMFPRETTMDKPNPYLMDRVEEWIATRSGDEEIALEVGGRSKPENLDSLLTYIETKGMELGKKMFDKAKADAASRPARNVPVGRAATPGTPERAALDRLMSAEVPPKRRR